jgi:hypothetical protein
LYPGRIRAVDDNAWWKIEGVGRELKRIPPGMQVPQVETGDKSSETDGIDHPRASPQLNLHAVGGLF